jgi:hypothetical protein
MKTNNPTPADKQPNNKPNNTRSNPSRWMEDNSNIDEPADSFVPFRTRAEAAQEEQNQLETSVIKIICQVFCLSRKHIQQANYQETGEYRLGVAGFRKAVHPRFPVKLTVVRPLRGKGEVFTLNRLLKNPHKFVLISEFIKKLKNWKPSLGPIMLVGLHPRINQYVAVTNLPLEPDLLCFNVLVEDIVEKSADPHLKEIPQHIQIVFGEFYRVLLAMQNQGVWTPVLE